MRTLHEALVLFPARSLFTDYMHDSLEEEVIDSSVLK